MNNIEYALSYFKEGFSCSQSVLAAYSGKLGLEENLALKVSSAFGGGIAQTGDKCGVVTGSLMVIGLKYGRVRAEDTAAKEKTYKLAKEFIEKFRVNNGSIVCRELIGLDIGTPEGMEKAKDEKLFEKVCPAFVRSASEILEGLLKE